MSKCDNFFPGILTGILTGILIMFSSLAVNAGPLDSLVMPGLLIKGHAKWEKECTKCHSLFEKTSQNKLCLDCHKKISGDVKQKSGFHGRNKKILKANCKFCHTDHEGREADVVQLDDETFDHNLTDFVLKGAHARVKCYGCHLPEKKYREAPGKCLACHRQDEPHFGRLGKKCDDCHQEKTWTSARFDHDKKTKFALKGRHKEVKCDACHPNERYKNTPSQCVDCHSLNDVHRGKFGKKCDKCHTSIKWKTLRFNHNRDTKFPLKFSHEKLKCGSCHSENPYKDKLKKECIACHKNDDEHKGRFGVECVKCHSEKAWKKPHFNHNRDTKFKLVGRHETLKCHDCHKGHLKKVKLKTQCYDCHQVDDVHKGQEGKKCDKCHNQNSWLTQVKFDHNKTLFPLIGIHAITTCEECHLTAEFKEVKSECVECHFKDDYHRKRLGPDCGLCHSPEAWNQWKFNHNLQTDFVLKEAHEKVECHSCHTKPAEKYIKLPETCLGCHKDDDVHKGQEGEKCDNCHNQTSWAEQIQFNHDLTYFPLIGIHAITSCESCHLSTEFKDVGKKCFDCHRQDDTHKRRLGPDCGLCHNPNHWNLWKFDHNTQTKFNLDGAHTGIECEACHREQVKKKITLSKLCSSCHLADDIHRGRFGRRCDQCHVSTSFREIKVRR